MERRQLYLIKTIWIGASLLVALFIILWGAQTWLRIIFPWDLYFWSESPFLTNMLKLDRHLPIYGPPADGNSFVYSPGMEYICFALLKPFGLELDIRCCRAVVVLIGVMAAVFAALAANRLAYPKGLLREHKIIFSTCFGVALLSLAKNFTFDAVHPDNLHALFAMLLFWLCFVGVENKKFGFALAAMILGGLGVFAKQTMALSAGGVFACVVASRQWNWRQCLALMVVGIGVSAFSLYLLWLSDHGRFWTFDLLASHRVLLEKIKLLPQFFFRVNGGLLPCLSLWTMFFFWREGGSCRRYLVCWFTVGLGSVLPAMAAYLKEEGMTNNLELFRNWIVLLICPFCLVLLNTAWGRNQGLMFQKSLLLKKAPVQIGFSLVVAFGMLWFLPTKRTPQAAHYDYAAVWEKGIREDLQQGRNVLLAHGTAALIRSGSRVVPLDRAVSILELSVGNAQALSSMRDRIKSRYYHHLYLTTGQWYGPELLAEIHKNYDVESIIKSPIPPSQIGFGHGFQRDLMADCLILKSKE